MLGIGVYFVAIIEQITGLLMDCNKMPANVRFDYAQIWDEIKAFTKIDGDHVKLLLLSRDWNMVAGSFDALFVHANEKSFCKFLVLPSMTVIYCCLFCFLMRCHIHRLLGVILTKVVLCIRWIILVIIPCFDLLVCFI